MHSTTMVLTNPRPVSSKHRYDAEDDAEFTCSALTVTAITDDKIDSITS